LTNTKKGIKMIRYSTQPSKNADVITNSPTSEIKTTKDRGNLNGADDGNDQSISAVEDLRVDDDND